MTFRVRILASSPERLAERTAELCWDGVTPA